MPTKPAEDEQTEKIVPSSGFTALAQTSAEHIRETIAINLGDTPMSVLDLPRIKMPTGDSKVWLVPKLDGNPVAEEELHAVMVGHRTIRLYWEVPFAEGGGGQPPNCSSADGKNGEGSPGGVCVSCPYNACGSDPGEGR